MLKNILNQQQLEVKVFLLILHYTQDLELGSLEYMGLDSLIWNSKDVLKEWERCLAIKKQKDLKVAMIPKISLKFIEAPWNLANI